MTAHRVLCLGTPCENSKLTAPSLSVETLATLSDYVLVEADGSRQLPLKAHEAHEPVIPAVSRQVICVVGASGFGKPIRESVHRPERFCALTGAAASDPVTPEQAAKAILAERLCDTMFLNQIDTEAQRPLADRFACRGAGRLRSPDRRRESSGRERLALPGYLKNMTGPLSPHSAAKPHFLRKSANISTESLIFANVFSYELHKNTVRGFTVNWFHGII
ncbi:MAG: selenium cofactor biosynthesis protein YqeC [Dysosmobacter sp.]